MIVREKIDSIISKLQALTVLNVQNNWQIRQTDKQTIPKIKSHNWQNAQLNENNYIVWQGGRQVRWLQQVFVLPENLQGYSLIGLSLRLALTWWAEDAQIFVNGQLVQRGDLFDSSARVLLTPTVEAGEKITVHLRLVSPGHDIGALMNSVCVYERDTSSQLSNLHFQGEPGFFAQEIAVLSKYLAEFEPEKLPNLLAQLNTINWQLVTDAQQFDNHLSTLRQNLLPLAAKQRQRSFQLLGHAHLDMAWLWTTAETYEVAQRTFLSVLSLQQDFPTLTFGHTTSALYEWIEINCPELFAQIQQAVKEGKWELLGGMWVEPEVNITGGESLVRQLLYGQKYLQAKFSQIAKVAWLPDSFGFTWQLPQILAQAGIEYFVTGKLHWNDSTKFPYGCFMWQSPDGTELLTMMSPPNLTGVMDTNPLTMANYGVEWEKQTGLTEALWLPGVGDHGGGPTRDMLEVGDKLAKSAFFPELKFTKAEKYLEQIAQQKSLPLWQDELYLELHRGCYTTHAEQKKYNRLSEGLLYQAELFATIAKIILQQNFQTVKEDNWQKNLENAWKKVLFNQFHDILPGTSITPVFAEAKQTWQEAIKIAKGILTEALELITNCINLSASPLAEAKPIVIFNSLNWQRGEVVEVAEDFSQWQIIDAEGKNIPQQKSHTGKILFLAEDIPSIGYKVFGLIKSVENRQRNPTFPDNWLLENNCLRIKINPNTGDIDSIWDKKQQREILSGSSNQLQAFTDQGQYWDAWNIDPEYEKYPLAASKLITIQWLEKGEIREIIRVKKRLGKSTFMQDYILEKNSPILKIKNEVDWQETHVLVKTLFPLAIKSEWANYEIACGVINRQTNPQTPAEKAKWEVSALNWANLGDETSGVALLNDCKYGYDAKPNCLRLTLLRSPLWPDPAADRGIHQFTYAIYPHSGNWQTAQTSHYGYQLNIPLLVNLKTNKKKIAKNKLNLPLKHKFIDLGADNLILMAFKPAENHQNFILRCYEGYGKSTAINLKNNLGLKISQRVNLLEQSQSQSPTITPWQIATFALEKQ